MGAVLGIALGWGGEGGGEGLGVGGESRVCVGFVVCGGCAVLVVVFVCVGVFGSSRAMRPAPCVAGRGHGAAR